MLLSLKFCPAFIVWARTFLSSQKWSSSSTGGVRLLVRVCTVSAKQISASCFICRSPTGVPFVRSGLCFCFGRPPWQSLDVDYVLVIFGGVTGYSSDDVNKFLWPVRIGSGVFPDDMHHEKVRTEKNMRRKVRHLSYSRMIPYSGVCCPCSFLLPSSKVLTTRDAVLESHYRRRGMENKHGLSELSALLSESFVSTFVCQDVNLCCRFTLSGLHRL